MAKITRLFGDTTSSEPRPKKQDILTLCMAPLAFALLVVFLPIAFVASFISWSSLNIIRAVHGEPSAKLTLKF